MTKLYTFGLDYGDGIEEEIDVRASSRVEARRLAKALVEDDYQPGAKLREMRPGGTSGTFTIHR